jgi:hypothetical protein
MKKSLMYAALTVVSAIGSAQLFSSNPASAAVIDFEGASGFANDNGEFFTVDGFRFTHTDVTSNGATLVSNAANVVEPTTTKLHAINHSIATMSAADGSAFALTSFDLGGSFVASPSRWADKIQVTANFAGGSSSTILVDLPAALPEYVSTSWSLTNVLSLVFAPSGSNGTGPNDFEFTLDNINVAENPAVPLPPALALFVSGLAALGLLARRSKRQAA